MQRTSERDVILCTQFCTVDKPGICKQSDQDVPIRTQKVIATWECPCRNGLYLMNKKGLANKMKIW